MPLMCLLPQMFLGLQLPRAFIPTIRLSFQISIAHCIKHWPLCIFTTGNTLDCFNMCVLKHLCSLLASLSPAPDRSPYCVQKLWIVHCRWTLSENDSSLLPLDLCQTGWLRIWLLLSSCTVSLCRPRRGFQRTLSAASVLEVHHFLGCLPFHLL